jgi:hypothetical protein
MHKEVSGDEPYTPRMRLENLHQLQPQFSEALVKRQLCVGLSDSHTQPVR